MMVTRMCSPHSRVILTPLHLPPVPTSPQAGSQILRKLPLLSFGLVLSEILTEKSSFFKRETSLPAIIQGKFWRAAAEIKYKITNLHDNGPGFRQNQEREKETERDLLQIGQ